MLAYAPPEPRSRPWKLALPVMALVLALVIGGGCPALQSEANAAAARPFGIHAVHFTTPAALRADLASLGLL